MLWEVDHDFAEALLDEHLKFCHPHYENWARDRRELMLKPGMDITEKYEDLRRMTSALGGRIGNDAMRMLREILVHELKSITRTRQADMTPTLARNILRTVSRRSVDDNLLFQNFGTPGRTASQKTTWTVSDFEEEIPVLEGHLYSMRGLIKTSRDPIREHYKEKYYLRA